MVKADLRARRAGWRLSVGFLACLALGCGGKPQRASSQAVPITGKVTLNGEPLAGAAVIFTTQTLGIFDGATGSDGVYHLNSSFGGEQICEGPCKVTISKFVLPEGQTLIPDMSPQMQGGKELLPPKYSNSMETTLTATVPKEGGTFDFALESK